jgi:hypothetical protein
MAGDAGGGRVTEDVHPMLRPTAADRAADTLRALTSAVDLIAPGVGSVFGQLIGSVIPNLRSERFELYLTLLGRRLRALDTRLEALAERLGPEGIALFEEGARSAGRATREERIRQVALLVSGGISADEKNAATSRDLMRILDEVTDSELALLDSFVWRLGPDPRGESGVRFHQGSAASWREAQMFHEMRLVRLERLALIKRETELVPGQQRYDGLSAVPQMVRQEPRLTDLGKRLLVEVGMGQSTWDEVLTREQVET